MESTISGLARELVDKLEALPDDHRLLVGISGIPASGKSSLAHAIVSKVNEMHSSSNVAVLVGLDGWHLSRETLATFPNSEEAFARRGAHWTFDGDDYVRFVKQLRLSADVHAPSFSHSLKDPVHNDIHVLPHHKIVLIEGLYVFLSIDPWRVAGEMLDERWFVEVDMIDAMQRLVKRHIQTGVTATLDEAQRRGEENDFPNGEFVMQHMLSPTKRLKSVHDPSIAI